LSSCHFSLLSSSSAQRHCAGQGVLTEKTQEEEYEDEEEEDMGPNPTGSIFLVLSAFRETTAQNAFVASRTRQGSQNVAGASER
jgi:hypothetical protein